MYTHNRETNFGLLHFLLLLVTPPPQVREHDDHADQALQPPLTGVGATFGEHTPFKHICNEYMHCMKYKLILYKLLYIIHVQYVWFQYNTI